VRLAAEEAINAERVAVAAALGRTIRYRDVGSHSFAALTYAAASAGSSK
jgi:hypothetical protein